MSWRFKYLFVLSGACFPRIKFGFCKKKKKKDWNLTESINMDEDEENKQIELKIVVADF